MAGEILALLAKAAEIAEAVVKVCEAVCAVIETLKKVAETIKDIGVALGLIDDEDPEELGEKALEAGEAGIELGKDGLDTYEKYYNAIKDFEIDPKKAEMRDQREKLNKGINVMTGVIAEKYDGIKEVFSSIAKNIENGIEAFSPERIKGYIQKDISLKDVVSYLNGSEKDMDRIDEISSKLSSVEKQINPEISDEQAHKIANRNYGSIE